MPKLLLFFLLGGGGINAVLDEQSHGLGIQRKMLQHDNQFPKIFGLKNPVMQKTFQPTRAISILARASLCIFPSLLLFRNSDPGSHG